MIKSKPRVLDLFCGAGGCSVGYYRAGFDVVGVDINPQPNYPFEFIQHDALSISDILNLSDFDLIHASPPCQIHTRLKFFSGKHHLDLIPQTRSLLKSTGKFFVIENVPGAPLVYPVKLCGLMFNLRVIRHRWFETNPWLLSPSHPKHPEKQNVPPLGSYSCFKNSFYLSVISDNFNRKDAMVAMGVDWHVSKYELSQMIPPSFTEYIGKLMLHFF